MQRWPAMKTTLAGLARFEGNLRRRDAVLQAISKARAQPYLEAMPAMGAATKAEARAWLQSIIDRAEGIWKAEPEEVAKAHRQQAQSESKRKL